MQAIMLKTLFITAVIAAFIMLIVSVFHLGEAPRQQQPSPEPFSQTLQNKFFRAIFAKDELKKIARDPDSVAVESVSEVEHFHLKNGSDTLGFSVYYRAKNGLGGYQRDSRWLICNLYGNNVRFLNSGQEP
jgi:hypothetical protein